MCTNVSEKHATPIFRISSVCMLLFVYIIWNCRTDVKVIVNSKYIRILKREVMSYPGIPLWCVQDHSALGGIWSDTRGSAHIPVSVLDGRILYSPQTHQHNSYGWRKHWGLWLRSLHRSGHFQQPMDPTGHVPHIRGSRCILCCCYSGECCSLCSRVSTALCSQLRFLHACGMWLLTLKILKCGKCVRRKK